MRSRSSSGEVKEQGNSPAPEIKRTVVSRSRSRSAHQSRSRTRSRYLSVAVTFTSHLKLELVAAEREAARRGEDPTTGPAVTPGGGRAQGPGAAGATGAGAGRAGGAGAGPVRATDFMSGVSCSSLPVIT